MNEILILNSFLFVACVLAPLMTNSFFLKDSRVYADGHKTFLLILLCGTLVDFKYASVVWPLFCAWGFLLYLKREVKFVFSSLGVATCIPFVFSLISATWFIAGTYDLHLLGYPKNWSFYAAIHGGFIGWIFVGCLAFLAKRENLSKIYLIGCYLCLFLFLLIAFGIDGIPYIKRIGVIGLSLLIPLLIGHYIFNLRKDNTHSRILSSVSLFSIFLSMTLAILNEFWLEFPKVIGGIPTMVLIHGSLNALLAVPSFFLAIKMEKNEPVKKTEIEQSLVLFDDVCVLCSGTVALLIKLDKERKLKYSSLQGQFVRTLEDLGGQVPNQSVVFRSKGKTFVRAEAAIQILLKLGGFYKILGLSLSALPLFILNAGYDLMARNRYRIFGKNNACFVPAGRDKDLFIP